MNGKKTAETIIRKYFIRCFDLHLEYSVSVSVADVICFVVFLRWLFENKQEARMKLKFGG